MRTVAGQMESRIYGSGRGWAFGPTDFSDLAGRSMADGSLFQMEEAGTIRRVLRGVYD